MKQHKVAKNASVVPAVPHYWNAVGHNWNPLDFLNGLQACFVLTASSVGG